MMKPLVYVSFGMAKSGSALAFQLTRSLLEASGVPQPRLSDYAIDPEKTNNFMKIVKPGPLESAIEEIQHFHEKPIVIKTQGGVWKRTAQELENGRIMGQAVARDPRDIALFMMDAAKKGKAWGAHNGRAHRTIEDAMVQIRGMVAKHRQWIESPGIIPIDYETLVFDTMKVAQKIAKQLSLSPKLDFEACVFVAKSRVGQLNRPVKKGGAKRYEREMEPDLATRYYDEFKDFIDLYC